MTDTIIQNNNEIIKSKTTLFGRIYGNLLFLFILHSCSCCYVSSDRLYAFGLNYIFFYSLNIFILFRFMKSSDVELCSLSSFKVYFQNMKTTVFKFLLM